MRAQDRFFLTATLFLQRKDLHLSELGGMALRNGARFASGMEGPISNIIGPLELQFPRAKMPTKPLYFWFFS